MLFVPGDGPAQAFVEGRARSEAELALGPGDVQGAARLARGRGRVPADLPAEAAQPGDQLRQVADGDLHPRADVDGLRLVVALGGAHDALGGVLDVDELTRRRAGAPALDERLAPVAGIDALLDERGDDVGRGRIEVVAGSVEVDGQEEDGVEPVLLAVGLALYEERLLGDAVRRIGLLGIAVPQVLFL